MDMPTFRGPETYSERSLDQSLEFASRNLLPTTGYQLRLEGILPSARTLNELEAYFKVEIDASEGASISLGYDEKEDVLTLDEFSVSLKHNRGVAQLVRVISNNLIPVVFNKAQMPFPHKDHVFPPDKVEELLEGFGVSEAPLNDATAYRQWLSSLLSITQGWKISEQLEIPLAASDTVSQSYRVVNEQTFDRASQSRIDIKKFVRSIV